MNALRSFHTPTTSHASTYPHTSTTILPRALAGRKASPRRALSRARPHHRGHMPHPHARGRLPQAAHHWRGRSLHHTSQSSTVTAASLLFYYPSLFCSFCLSLSLRSPPLKDRLLLVLLRLASVERSALAPTLEASPPASLSRGSVGSESSFAAPPPTARRMSCSMRGDSLTSLSSGIYGPEGGDVSNARRMSFADGNFEIGPKDSFTEKARLAANRNFEGAPGTTSACTLRSARSRTFAHAVRPRPLSRLQRSIRPKQLHPQPARQQRRRRPFGTRRHRGQPPC